MLNEAEYKELNVNLENRNVIYLSSYFKLMNIL